MNLVAGHIVCEVASHLGRANLEYTPTPHLTSAKEECLRNLEAKKTEQAVSLEQYNLWKDHRQITMTQRSRAKTMNCTSNGAGGFYCY